jgi:hypothetical protein
MQYNAMPNKQDPVPAPMPLPSSPISKTITTL